MSINKIISYVFSDASMLQKDFIKMGALLKALNFSFSEYKRDLCAEIYINHDTKDTVALCMMNQDYRSDMYSDWVDSREQPIPSLTLRYLYDNDFKDWTLSNGEWEGRN